MTRRALTRCLRACALLGGIAAGCGHQAERDAAALTGGDPERGRILVERYGCGACHVIPGIPGADATVGPPLSGIARRSYVAGVLPNTPANLERWILNPPAVDPLTAMPVTGVEPRQAVDIAAYLYTLR